MFLFSFLSRFLYKFLTSKALTGGVSLKEKYLAVYFTIPPLLTHIALHGRMTDKLERVWMDESCSFSGNIPVLA
jgi:hypothetical protein